MTVSGVIVDVILFCLLAGSAILGYRKGLAQVMFSICSTIVAIILVFILYGPVTNYIVHNTKVSQTLENSLEEKFEELFQKEEHELAEQWKEKDNISSILEIFVGDEVEHLVEDTKDTAIQYISAEITRKIVSVVVFFGLFTVIRLLLLFLKNYVDLLTSLPIIRTLNRSGGMIYGIIKGFLIIYMIFAIISLILPIIDNTVMITAIENAMIGSKMFHHNIILNIIF